MRRLPRNSIFVIGDPSAFSASVCGMRIGGSAGAESSSATATDGWVGAAGAVGAAVGAGAADGAGFAGGFCANVERGAPIVTASATAISSSDRNLEKEPSRKVTEWGSDGGVDAEASAS